MAVTEQQLKNTLGFNQPPPNRYQPAFRATNQMPGGGSGGGAGSGGGMNGLTDNNALKTLGGIAVNPLQNLPLAGNLFGGGGHHEQMQQGYDFGNNQGDQTALQLGTPGYTPSYDSNTKGSFQGAYNTVLNQLTPDQLISRYSQGSAPMYQTGLDQSNAAAYNSFKSIVGRAPTASELSQALPIFQQPNGTTLGNAWLSQYKQQLMQNPNDPLNQGKASGYAGAINQTFQSMLGRNATSDEVNHFGGLLATGNVDQYQLQDFLKGTPEYQTSQDTQFRQGLDTQLQKSDLGFFDQAKQNVLSQFMQNGTGNSSALDSALTDLMGKISSNRSDYLTGLSAQQYGGNKSLALNNYANTQNQFLDNQSYNRNNARTQQGYLQGRSDNLSDYQTQMQDFMNMNQGGGRSNTYNALNGALQGAGAFARTGNPFAIGAGAAAGGAFGYIGGK